MCGKKNFIFTVADALEVIENKRYDYWKKTQAESLQYTSTR